MAVKKKYNALGRGLDALISMDDVKTEGSSNISEVSLDKIEPNPDQPRRAFDEDGLQDKADRHRAAHHPPRYGRRHVDDHSRRTSLASQPDSRPDTHPGLYPDCR